MDTLLVVKSLSFEVLIVYNLSIYHSYTSINVKQNQVVK